MWKQISKDEFVDRIKDLFSSKEQDLESGMYAIVDMQENCVSDIYELHFAIVYDYMNAEDVVFLESV